MSDLGLDLPGTEGAGSSSASNCTAPPRKPQSIAIFGADHVGIPLALCAADAGLSVRLLDLDSKPLEALSQGCLPYLEDRGEALLSRCRTEFPDRLRCSTELSQIDGCEVVIVTTGTSVDQHLNPDCTALEARIDALQPFLKPGQTLLLRSAIFPGSTDRVAQRLTQAGLTDVAVAFVPERLAEGKRIAEMRQFPQIVAVPQGHSMEPCRRFFEAFNITVVELPLLEAEVSVLFLNAWRYVTLGTANQFYQIATSKGLSFNRIRSGIMYKYRRSSGFPSAGFTAGPRLLKDTMQLAAFSRHTFSLGHAAMLVNETMPDCVLDELRRLLTSHGKELSEVKCGLLGMAFKPGSDDTRESLAFKFRSILEREGAKVKCTDVHIQRDDFLDVGALLEWADVLVVGCPHPEYKALALPPTLLVLDCWGDLRPLANGEEEVEFLEAKLEAPPAAASAVRVAVIGGAGHVGLPLSLALAEAGHEVVIVDHDRTKLDDIAKGKFPFLEEGGPELLRKCLEQFPERLRLEHGYDVTSECDVVVVTIGTPVDEHLNPRFAVIKECIGALLPHLRREGSQTLLLRSTLFPGTSDRVRKLLDDAGFEGVHVSFCPERIAQGFAIEELRELPQIISGTDEVALEHSKALFAPLGVDLIVMSCLEAEVSKLFLNAWRYVAFGTANQFYHIAMEKGLNFERIRNAIVGNYPRAARFPRSGFTAGPCLFKDTMQLAAYCRHAFSLGHAAMLVNETMPDCLLSMARSDASDTGKQLSSGCVGILGMAFKPDNDDFRESLAFKLRRLLLWEGCDVLCTDVYIQRPEFVDLTEVLRRCDIIFIGCPHREYRELRFRADQRVYDCWGAFPSYDS